MTTWRAHRAALYVIEIPEFLHHALSIGKTTLRSLARGNARHERESRIIAGFMISARAGSHQAHRSRCVTPQVGREYRLNLLDTPGHVDFAYEVSRSLAACEGALLIVDAAQGVEAQTVANVHLAHKQGLTIIPVINKIDLPNADIPAVHKQLEEILAIPAGEAIDASAKMGIGIEEILEAIVDRVPAPPKPADEILRGLVFDCVFDIYRGVVAYVRVFSGNLQADQAIKLINNDARYEVKEVGVFTPKMFPQKRLQAGDVGYFIANMKSTADIKIGDTVTDLRIPPRRYPVSKSPDGFSGSPINTGDFEHWKTAIVNATEDDGVVISRKAPSRSVSDSAAVFSVCSTWRSSRSGSGANTTWILSPRLRASFMKSSRRAAKRCLSIIQRTCPTRA